MDTESKNEMQANPANHTQEARRSEWESVFSIVKAEVPTLDSDSSLELYGPTKLPEKDVTQTDLVENRAVTVVPGVPQSPVRTDLSGGAEETLRQPDEEHADTTGTQTVENCYSEQSTPPNMILAAEYLDCEKCQGSRGVDINKTELHVPKETSLQHPRALSNPEGTHLLPFQHSKEITKGSHRDRGASHAKPHRGLSLESLQRVEHWDLDSILHSIEEHGDSIAQTTKNTSQAASSSFASIDCTPLRSEARVMEQLELLCARQSLATSYTRRDSASTQMVSNKTSPEKDQDKNSVVRLSPSDNIKAENGFLMCPPSPPTVYIDLRNTEPQQSALSPPDAPEIEESMNITGKGLLLQQIRRCRKGLDPHIESSPLAAPKEAESQQDTETSEAGGMPIIRRKRRAKVRVEWRKSSSPESTGQLEAETETRTGPTLDHPNMTTPTVQNKIAPKAGSSPEPAAEEPMEHPTRNSIENPTENGLDSAVMLQDTQPIVHLPEIKASSRAEEKQVERIKKEDELKEKRRRQRLQQQLETLKPRHSINGKQPMAEKTPVLFHMESSYLPDISMLPAAATVKQEMFLMTVWMSSCGHVASAGLSGGRVQETAISAANIYHALLTWLISLVPTISVQSAGSSSSDAPFQVVGLQQTWREDGLALYACLAPLQDAVSESSPKTRKNKTKEDMRGMSTFYQKICKYLSHTLLQNVIWWRGPLIHRLQDHIFPVLPEIPAVRLNSITTINPDPEAVEKAFSSPRGFYWQTIETDEKICSNGTDHGIDADTETEVALALLFETLLGDPMAFHHMLQLILSTGLDICGLRLLYPQPSVLLLSTEYVPSSYRNQPEKNLPPVLVIALRGPRASTTWQDISGPSDPQLACLTDHHSLNALYCQSRAEPLLYSPHTESRVLQELCVWFGGRVPSDGVVHVGIQNPSNKHRSSSHCPSNPDAGEGFLKSVTMSRPSATLISTTKGDIFLAVSPAVPPSAYGDVISTCTRRGFTLQGVRRIRMSAKRASMLSMSAAQIAVFCRAKPPCPQDEDPYVEPYLFTLLLLLRKENVGHHVLALIKGLMNEMAEQGLLAEIRRDLPAGTELQPSMCFHVAHYTDSLLQGLGGSLSTVPDCGSVALDMLSLRSFASNPEMEQVVVLTLIGKDAMKGAGALLRSILRPITRKQLLYLGKGDCDSGFELLGLKWLPSLSRSQAKEITPFEVGDKPWQQSIDQLVSSPALICVLRRINAFAALAETLKELTSPASKLGGSHGRLQRVMSSTPEMAFRQAALFFTDKDFVSDARSRPALKYILPPSRGNRTEGEETRRGVSESIFSYMLSGPQLICTVLLMKPGTWSRNLPKILRKLKLENFGLVAMRHVKLDLTCASALLPPEVLQDSVLLQDNCTYLTSDLSLVLCLQRQNAVKKLLDILGPDDPSQGQTQDMCLWRAQYGASLVQNAFYGSTCYQTAVRDMKMFFPEGLCCAQSPVLEEEKISNIRSDPLVSLEFHQQRQAVRRKLSHQFNSSGPAGSLCLSLPLHSALCQTICLVLPEGLLQGSGHPSYIPLLEHLVSRDFVLTGVRLTRLDQPQAHLIAELLGPVDSFSATRSLLNDSSCLVLAAQRDNAVSCFHSLMDSNDCRWQAVQECMQLLLYPKTEKEAEELLCCFFDSLTMDSIHQIVEKESKRGP
ncbi:dynein axonemal assembly factor 8 isoform X2 [Lissotriton helveticus]